MNSFKEMAFAIKLQQYICSFGWEVGYVDLPEDSTNLPVFVNTDKDYHVELIELEKSWWVRIDPNDPLRNEEAIFNCRIFIPKTLSVVEVAVRFEEFVKSFESGVNYP